MHGVESGSSKIGLDGCFVNVNPLHGVERTTPSKPKLTLHHPMMNPLHGVESYVDRQDRILAQLGNPLHGVESYHLQYNLT